MRIMIPFHMSPWLLALVCVQALPQGKLCLRSSYAEFGAYATTMTSSTQARLGWTFPPGDSETEEGTGGGVLVDE